MKKVLFLLMAMIAFGFQSVNAQDGMKIVSNHPDFKIKVKRCAASGKTVVIDLILTNMGSQDVENLTVYGGSDWGNPKVSEAYDSEGNVHKGGSLRVKLANAPSYTDNNESQSIDLLPEVPVRMSVKIDGVPISAESFPRLKLYFNCEKWGLNYDKMVVIRNIPISRN